METSSYAGPVSVWLSVPSVSMLKTASIIGSLTQVATQQARIQNVALVLLYNLPKHDRQPSSNETWAHGHRGTLGGAPVSPGFCDTHVISCLDQDL